MCRLIFGYKFVTSFTVLLSIDIFIIDRFRYFFVFKNGFDCFFFKINLLFLMTGGLLSLFDCHLCNNLCCKARAFLQRETNRKAQRELNNNSEGVFLGSP